MIEQKTQDDAVPNYNEPISFRQGAYQYGATNWSRIGECIEKKIKAFLYNYSNETIKVSPPTSWWYDYANRFYEVVPSKWITYQYHDGKWHAIDMAIEPKSEPDYLSITRSLS